MKKRIIAITLVIFTASIVGCASNKKVVEYNAPKSDAPVVYDKEARAKAHRELGEAYLAQKNYALAMGEFVKAENLSPNDHKIQMDIGLVFMARGKLDLAIERLKKAIEIKPDFAMARNNLGAAYMAKQDWDAAIASFKELTNDFFYATPHYPLSNMAKAYYHKKEFKLAQQYYEEALSIQPNFPNALFGLGQTYMALGQLPDAINAFEKTVQAVPELPEAHLELAHAYRLAGDHGKAFLSYERVCELSPNSELANEAKRIMGQLR